MIADLLPACRDAVEAADRLTDAALRSVGLMVAPEGKISGALLDREQLAVHGISWLAT